MAIANKLDGIKVGDFGETITLTLKDTDGTAQDISSFTTRQVHVRSPKGTKTVTNTATFTTDGTDGKLDFSFSIGEIDRPGRWEGQVELSKTGGESKSDLFEMNVEARLLK